MSSSGSKSKITSSTDPETQATTKLVREQVLNPLIDRFMPQWINALIGGAGDLPVAKSQSRSFAPPLVTQNINENTRRAGLAGSPFEARQQAEAKTSIGKSQAGVGPNLMLELLRMAPNMITGTGQNIINTGRGLGSQSGSTQTGANPGAIATQGVSTAAALASLYAAYASATAGTAAGAGSGATAATSLLALA